MKCLKRKPLFTVAMLFALTMGCKKDNSKELTVGSQFSIVNYDKIIRYLSITLGVSEETIMLDDKKAEFFIPNTVFRESVASVQERYNTANEYKLSNEDK